MIILFPFIIIYAIADPKGFQNFMNVFFNKPAKKPKRVKTVNKNITHSKPSEEDRIELEAENQIPTKEEIIEAFKWTNGELKVFKPEYLLFLVDELQKSPSAPIAVNNKLKKIEPLLSKDELKELGLNANLKISKEYIVMIDGNVSKDKLKLAERVFRFASKRAISKLDQRTASQFDYYLHIQDNACQQAKDLQKLYKDGKDLPVLPLKDCDCENCKCWLGAKT